MINDLTDSLGLKYFEEKNRNEVLARILELTVKNAGARIIESFSKEETAEFNKIQQDDLERMENFMLEKNPDAGKIFAEEAEKIKNAMLSAKIEKDTKQP